MKKSIWFVLGLLISGGLLMEAQEQKSNYNGLNLGMGNLSRLSRAKTRSISPENFTGEKGRAGMATEGTCQKCARDLGVGWKVSPSVRIKAGEVFTVADISGPGAVQRNTQTKI